MKLEGSCLCGEVRFEIDGPWPRLYQCHCRLCRKQGGSVSNTGMIVAADKFRFTAGEPLVKTWRKATGFTAYFCRDCGAPVPNPLRDTGYIWVASGLIDGDPPLEIGAQLYLDSTAPWDGTIGPGMRFEQAPSFAELIAMLHEGSRK